MAILGAYRINFTDPKNGSFVIDPYTVNGTATPVSNILHSSAVRSNTSLLLPGQYVSNYGELIHENMVHLLENFAGNVEPSTPIEGQLWYDVGDSFVIADLVVGGCVLEGNQSDVFSQHITNGTTLTAWYGPISVSDNSYRSIDFKVTSLVVNSSGNTQITITDVTGNVLQLPNTVAGGFVTASQASRLGRLKVAASINNSLVWTDVVNVLTADLPPVGSEHQAGDLWFDTVTDTLNVFVAGNWLSVNSHMLPLSGGTLTGPLYMGLNPISYVGPVQNESTLTNKLYVDSTIAALIDPLSQTSANGLLNLGTRLTTVETTLPLKVDVSGDVMTGPLVFGSLGDSTTLSHGIDMKNHPIVNPSITWDAADYLTPIGETHNVVDKTYIGRALQQHINDVAHGGVQFITEEVDGTGLITNSIHFDSILKDLTWVANNTVYGVGVDTDSLILTTGNLIGAGFEFRQFGVAGDPLFRITDTHAISAHTLYLLDGQPQPDLNGAANALNDETAAATKGYVKSAVTTAVTENAAVIGTTFAYDINALSYPLTIQRRDDTDIVVNINHEHSSTKIKHAYVPLTNWNGGSTDAVEIVLGAGTHTVADIIDAINSVKAPIHNARFTNAPVLYSVDTVLEINNVSNWFRATQQESTIQVGFKVTITESDSTETVYTVTSIDPVDDGNGGFDLHYYVDAPLPTIVDLAATPATATYAIYAAPTNRTALVNRETVDNAILLGRTPQCFPMVCSDETTALTIGTANATFRVPFALKLTGLRASLTVAQAAGALFTVDVKKSGVSILSTLLTIDNTEKTSKTAATPVVISDINLADDVEITVDITQVGDGSAKGLKIYLIGIPV